MLKGIFMRVVTFSTIFILSMIFLSEITFRLLPGETIYNIAAFVNPFHFIDSLEALLIFYVLLSLLFAFLSTKLIKTKKKITSKKS